jgi:hypothetical protein
LLLYNYSDWNTPNITSLFQLLKKMSGHYAAVSGGSLRVTGHYNFLFLRDESETLMLAIRLYIGILTLVFLFLVIASRGLGTLEAIITTCAILYLILDVRTDLQSSKNELRLLTELEKQVSLLLR